MATTEQRIKFLKETIEILQDTEHQTRKIQEEVLTTAKKINVSSVYKVANMIADIAEDTNQSTIIVCTKVGEMMGVYKKNPNNTGDYMDLVKKVLTLAENSKPSRISLDRVSLNSDANEDMSNANIESFNDSLKKIGVIARNNLLNLSANARELKKDDNDIAKLVGRSVEGLTNSIITTTNKITTQVNEMAAYYKVELVKLDDIAATFNQIKTADANVNIKITESEF